MLDKLLQWPPQPSTVIGIGVLFGLAAYLVTGDAVWAIAAAGVVKVLLPDNSAAPGQVTDAIKSVAAAVGKPLPAIVAGFALAAMLTACTGPLVTTSAGGGAPISGAALQQDVQDAATVIAGLQAIVPSIAAVDQNAADQVTRGLAAARAGAQSLQGATSGQAQLSAVQEFEDGINAVLAAANALHLGGTAGTVISAVATLAPVVETGLNIAMAAPVPQDEAAINAARLVLIRAAQGAA